MEILRFLLYVLAPWVPFLLRNRLYKFKVWQILLVSIILLLPFSLPLFFGCSFSTPFIFSFVFVLFLISFSTIGWLLTNNRRFVLFATIINLPTILLFYFINWQTNPYNNEAGRPKNRILNVESSYYSDIEISYVLGVLKTYHARRKVFGGLLVKSFELETINETDTCLYKGFNDKGKKFYWNKCTNKINVP
jgi:hypothetical protein